MLPKYIKDSERGIRMGLTMREKKSVTKEFIMRYQKATKKEKHAILNEFVFLTQYHRKYAI